MKIDLESDKAIEYSVCSVQYLVGQPCDCTVDTIVTWQLWSYSGISNKIRCCRDISDCKTVSNHKQILSCIYIGYAMACIIQCINGFQIADLVTILYTYCLFLLFIVGVRLYYIQIRQLLLYIWRGSNQWWLMASFWNEASIKQSWNGTTPLSAGLWWHSGKVWLM